MAVAHPAGLHPDPDLAAVRLQLGTLRRLEIGSRARDVLDLDAGHPPAVAGQPVTLPPVRERVPVRSPNVVSMCRNITTLRGLEPAATDDEVEAAARQYVRKVSGVQATSAETVEAFEKAVRTVAEATAELLAHLPARRRPPPTLPPLRRRAAATP
jgi:hypothetical protein